LSKIHDLLSEDHLGKVVDRPIDLAVAAFDLAEKTRTPVTNEAFLELTGDFARHVSAHGLAVPRELNRDQARAEAVSILMEHYDGQSGRGCEAAFLDATLAGPTGTESVLSLIASAIKWRERCRYVRWVFSSSVDPFDWQLKVAMVRVLKKRLFNHLPSYLANCEPERLADLYDTLILIETETADELSRLLVALTEGFSN